MGYFLRFLVISVMGFWLIKITQTLDQRQLLTSFLRKLYPRNSIRQQARKDFEKNYVKLISRLKFEVHVGTFLQLALVLREICSEIRFCAISALRIFHNLAKLQVQNTQNLRESSENSYFGQVFWIWSLTTLWKICTAEITQNLILEHMKWSK